MDLSKFYLYCYLCSPHHYDIDSQNIFQEDYEEFNKKADENMVHHQEYFQKFFDTDEIPNVKKDQFVFLRHNNATYCAKILMNQGGIIILNLKKERIHQYELNFQFASQKEEPSSMIIIDNRHEMQRILIENSKNTFAPSTIAKILETNIVGWLNKNYSLNMRVPMVYRKDEFWNIVREYPNGIKTMIFKFPYPNMARPMQKMAASLKQFGIDMRGSVELVTKAQKKDFLVISPREKNEDLDEIVSYLSDVGAPVDIYLVNGRRVKCFSKNNPIVMDVSTKIANFRGTDSQNLFPEQFFETVAELMNSLKSINYND